ncbi:MAG TPA: DNA primase [Actinomycetota bacterium]|nr:DNA primase [Actinomycetota bacterium]
MARIRQEDVEAVKERTDIVQLVGQYLTLKKTGHDSLSGLCPFHQEKSASFSVSPSKQVFYCFGCGVGGDAITFLRQLEQLTYVEAIERLAQTAGVQLRFENDSPAERRSAERRTALFRANEEAGALFRAMLVDGREGADARAYVAERGVDDVTADRFGIGYAPTYPDFLLRRLSGARHLSTEILLEAGLATRGEDGGVRDRFRGRITFPIHDLQGRAIGFGARILPSDPRAGEQAKYLNTAETPIYRKHEVLYNLHRARGAIARSGDAFVVEGYTDVIGLAQAGLDNAVATCGTALGEQHFALLSRFAQRAVLAFDSDEAGARAAERAAAFQEAYPVQAVVMIMPEGLDPAEFVAKHGADAVHEAARKARPLIEYMLRRTVDRHDLSTVEGRSAAVADAIPLLERLSDPVRRSEYTGLLADLAGVAESGVRQALDRRLGGRPQEVAKAIKHGTAQERVEREMLKVLLIDADTFGEMIGTVSEERFRSAANRRLFVAIRDAGGDVAAIAGGPDVQLAAQIAALAVEPLEGEPTRTYAENVSARLQEFELKSTSDRLRLQLQKLNPTTDPGYDQLFQELVQVDGELRRVRQRVAGTV